MSGILFDKYGAILAEDVEILEACLAQVCPKETVDEYLPIVRVVEIGMHDGATARGIKAFIEAHRAQIDYWGIDPDPGKTRPRISWEGGYHVVIGDSAEVFNQIPDQVDLLWIDGCHCFNHSALDLLHYSPKVRPGGFMCFHDTNPAGEGAEHQYHGPEIPEFGLATNQALKALRFPWPNWRLFADNWPTDVHNCGTRAYQRIA